jgi:hypothetical protein
MAPRVVDKSAKRSFVRREKPDFSERERGRKAGEVRGATRLPNPPLARGRGGVGRDARVFRRVIRTFGSRVGWVILP